MNFLRHSPCQSALAIRVADGPLAGSLLRSADWRLWRRLDAAFVQPAFGAVPRVVCPDCGEALVVSPRTCTPMPLDIVL